jgi:hypothetical protein
MTTVYLDPPLDDEIRRNHLFAGHILLYSPRPSSVALIDHAREMIEEAFAGKDPATAQFDKEVESYARLLADLKPRFIHHPPSKERIRENARRYRLRPGSDILRRPADAKLDVRQLHDVGHRLRLSSQRDTWYSPPMAQVNFCVDAFHVVRLGLQAMEEVRRRVQQQLLGHRGRKNDSLYKIRNALRAGNDKLTPARSPGSRPGCRRATRTPR